MLFSYKEFIEILNSKIKNGKEFYIELLKKIIDNPNRYCSTFRLASSKTKLIQNITQSQEIKFGDFLEDITTKYIEKLGYLNLNKNLGKDNEGNILKADQIFTDNENKKIYLVEQKVRDDHDSTKKRGQFQNFNKKISFFKNKFPEMHLTAIIWFVDNQLIKNKNYYLNEIKKSSAKYKDVEIHLYYGKDFFESIKNGLLVWNEIVEYLTKARKQNSSIELKIPDFAKSDEIYEALIDLPDIYWNKLNSDKYKNIREEFFLNGPNLEKAKMVRNKRNKNE